MDRDTLVCVEHLSRDYGGIRAVDDVSFELVRGEILGFLGPNGAGKTTTMQIISGNLAPTVGRVTINGIDIIDDPKAAKAHIGYLPEQPPLYREFTVDEYLLYCARLNRIPAADRQAAVATAKQRCGLTEVGRRLIDHLSKGFRQRVGIAQAIIHAPAVVILDEPTVGLDPIQIREIRSLIRELGRDHSVILSTHILPEVQSLCNRVQIINKGAMVLNDTIEGLQRRMLASSLVVALRRAPHIDRLRAVAGVQDVESIGDGRFRLHYKPEDDPAETLAAQAVEHNWGLHEMTPERMSLEEIFVDITRTEQPPDGADEAA